MKKIVAILMILGFSGPVFAWENEDSKKVAVDLFIILIEEAAKDGKYFFSYESDYYDVIYSDPMADSRYLKDNINNVAVYYIYNEYYDFLNKKEREKIYTAFLSVIEQESYCDGDLIEVYHNR